MGRARRDSTTKLYEVYWKQWIQFCNQRGQDPTHNDVITGINFLQDLLDRPDKNRGYSVINTARSALSAMVILPTRGKFGEHPYVTEFMKGVYNLYPPKPRYTDIWDPEIVLEFLRNWRPAKKISLKMLSLKVVMLILLITGQRPQIISKLNVENMEISEDCYLFTVENHDLKQGRPGYKPERICLKAFEDKSLCVHRYLTEYLKRTLDKRGKVKELFITLNKPHKQITRDTTSRWIRTVLNGAGINTQQFKPGSTRAASTSKARECGANMDEILKAGGWSRETTFAKWYNKPINTRRRTLGEIILK